MRETSILNNAIHEYTATYKDHFNLFGEMPFLQQVTLSRELEHDREQPLSIEQLRRETAAPGGKTLFDHTIGDNHILEPAEAACYLVADQFFGLQDGRGYSQSPLSSGIASMARGRNLRETLLLNLVPYDEFRPIRSVDFANDYASWEEVSSKSEVIPSGWLSYMTRQYRRLLLLRDSTGQVTHVYRKAADQLDREWRSQLMDPWIAYRFSDAGMRAIDLQPGRALWRDSPAIIQQFLGRGVQHPGYVRLLSRLDQQAAIEVWGIRAASNAIELWRHEVLALPVKSLEDPGLRTWLEKGIQTAEAVGNKLVGSVRRMVEVTLAPTTKPDRSRVTHLLEALAPERAYWPALDLPFRTFIGDLADQFDEAGKWGQQAREAWADAIARAARTAFDKAADALATSGRGYRAAAEAQGKFNGGLAGALHDLRLEVSV